jgi:bifunctional non-homologous end joining protein LigD
MTEPVFPATVPPMLATPGAAPTGPGWAYEFKWDGVRAVVYAQPAQLRVLSRNNRDVTASYPELDEVTRLLGDRQAVLDGEVVALDPADRPSFAQLQRRMHVFGPPASLLAEVPIRYYVFDVLHLDGDSTLDLPYRRRRQLLAGLGLTGDVVRAPEHVVGADPAQVMASAAAKGLEGVVAKRLSSAYRPGRRSPDWIKTPFSRTQEVVVVGYKPGTGRRSGTIGALVLAVHDQAGALVFAGGVGTGFTDAMLHDLQQALAPLHRSTPTVTDIPREHARGVHWVQPDFVGEVAYRNWTPDGRLRHPSWRGLRPDRTPAEARRPEPADAPAPIRTATVEGAMQSPDGHWRIEVMRRGTSRWYRLTHHDNVLDWLTITDVERILTDVGVDISHLTETGPTTSAGSVPA